MVGNIVIMTQKLFWSFPTFFKSVFDMPSFNSFGHLQLATARRTNNMGFLDFLEGSCSEEAFPSCADSFYETMHSFSDKAIKWLSFDISSIIFYVAFSYILSRYRM